MNQPPRTAPESFGGSIFDDRAAQNEFFQHRESEIGYGTNPADGLPSPVVTESPYETLAALYHPDTFVCMADTRAFVLRDGQGAVVARFAREDVARRGSGGWSVARRIVIERITEQRFVGGFAFLRTLGSVLINGNEVEVEPVRPQCKHYARQKTDFHAARDNRMLTRVCTAQHSESGEYYSLQDSAMYACELRSPRDPFTELQLEEWDDKLIAEAERQRSEKKFDVEAELKKEIK